MICDILHKYALNFVRQLFCLLFCSSQLGALSPPRQDKSKIDIHHHVITTYLSKRNYFHSTKKRMNI